MSIFEDLFGSMGHISWWQECARAVVIFGCGLLFIRLAGRRIFAKWSALDTIVAIVVGSNLSRALTGSAPLGGTLLATGVLMALHWLLAQVAARSRLASRVLEGSPIELARGGRLKTRHSVAISETDLHEALRRAGVEAVEETRLVMLEPSGRISILK